MYLLIYAFTQKVLGSKYSVDEDREDPNTTNFGYHRPPAKHNLNGGSLTPQCRPYIECWLNSFVIVKGIWASIAKGFDAYCDFSGGGIWTPCPITLDPCMLIPKVVWSRRHVPLRQI